jgi:dTDP-glucose 4,6-dehydratase
MTRRILVTGGAGFIGSNFVRYWAETHPSDRVVVVDALTYAGNPETLADLLDGPKLSLVQADIRDGEKMRKLMTAEKIDVVVHFAAESHVDRSIDGPDAFVSTNIVGTHELLKAARAVWGGSKQGGTRFHHVSTDEVYGSLQPGDPAFTETTSYAPNSPYAASKAASDHLVRAYHQTYGLPVTTSNCSNNYGPFQFPEKLIPLVIVNALGGLPIPVYGDGLQVRDWLYVIDHCRGIELVLDRGKIGETYNFGGDSQLPNIEIVRLLCSLIDDAFGTDAELAARFPAAPPAAGNKTGDLIKFVTDRPGHDRRYAIDSSKSTAELGYRPSESLESGLKKTVRWYLDNREWWEHVMDGSYRDWIARQYQGAVTDS